MRTPSRTVCGLVLAAAVGCGGPTPTEAPPPSAAATKPDKAADPTPPAATPPAATPPAATPPKVESSPPPADPYQMDPAKHAVPAAPVAGKFDGQPFAPAAVFEGDALVFRVPQDGKPDREVKLKLPAAKATAGLTLVVRPDQKPGDDVPELYVPAPAGGAATEIVFQNGYALTLELGKKANGKLPGKLYLCLPGDDKSYLAGTFAADWQKPIGAPPDADDAPFVQGKLSVTGGSPDPKVRAGYVGGLADGQLVQDTAEIALDGKLGLIRTEEHKPRITTVMPAESTKGAGRFEHVKLPPGRYLVFARVADGPAAWKWVTVAADSQLTADLAIDAGKVGGVTVKLPADAKGPVRLVPADETPLPDGLALGGSVALGLSADPKDGAATFAGLAPGKYEVRAGDLTGTADVTAGQTATVELTAPKK